MQEKKEQVRATSWLFSQVCKWHIIPALEKTPEGSSDSTAGGEFALQLANSTSIPGISCSTPSTPCIIPDYRNRNKP